MRSLWLFICLLISPLLSAKVMIETQDEALTVWITEQIAPGDYAHLQAALADAVKTAKTKHARLDNIGGSLAEAMRIGRWLRTQGFSIEVPNGAICQGSCVYLLAGGVTRQVFGALAIHHPYHAGGESHLAKAEAAQAPAAYLADMGLSPALAYVIAQTAPHSPRLLSQAEMKRFGLINANKANP